MALEFKFTGVDAVLKNLNREAKAIKNRSELGLYKAALDTKAKAVKRTPWLTGNLAGSAYLSPDRPATSIEIGYTAYYAPFVHEIEKSYRKPGTSWKFLEKALQENAERILEFIRKG